TNEPYFKAKINLLKDIRPTKKDKEYHAINESIKEVAIDIVKKNPNIPSEASFAIRNIESPSFLVNYVAANMDLRNEEKQKLLAESDLKARATATLRHLNIELQKLQLRMDIQSKTRSEMDQQQREYYLNQQLRTIQEELGGVSQEQEVEELVQRAKSKEWTAEVGNHFDKELKRLKRLNPQM